MAFRDSYCYSSIDYWSECGASHIPISGESFISIALTKFIQSPIFGLWRHCIRYCPKLIAGKFFLGASGMRPDSFLIKRPPNSVWSIFLELPFSNTPIPQIKHHQNSPLLSTMTHLALLKTSLFHLSFLTHWIHSNCFMESKLYWPSKWWVLLFDSKSDISVVLVC
jgi:hypothetical protein